MTITRFHHLATVVPTLEAGAAVWRDLFGLEIEAEATVPEQGVRACLAPCGDGEIELLQALDAESPIAKFLAKGGGIHHLCWESDDVGAELARIDAAGVRLIDKAPRCGLAGQIGFLHPKATLSSLIEIATPGGGVDTTPFADPHPHGAPFTPVAVRSITFAVDDLDAAVATFETNFAKAVDADIVDVPELGAQARIFDVNNTRIQLARPAGPGRLQQRLDAAGVGAGWLEIQVRALDPGLGSVRERGIGVDETTGTDGRRVAFLDPAATYGVAVALTE